MPTRELIHSDDPTVRRYRVRDDGGREIGTDVEAVRTPQQVNESTLRSRAAQALATNAAFLALVAPTNAQNATQVQRLTRECSALIRLLLELTDTTDGT